MVRRELRDHREGRAVIPEAIPLPGSAAANGNSAALATGSVSVTRLKQYEAMQQAARFNCVNNFGRALDLREGYDPNTGIVLHPAGWVAKALPREGGPAERPVAYMQGQLEDRPAKRRTFAEAREIVGTVPEWVIKARVPLAERLRSRNAKQAIKPAASKVNPSGRKGPGPTGSTTRRQKLPAASVAMTGPGLVDWLYDHNAYSAVWDTVTVTDIAQSTITTTTTTTTTGTTIKEIASSFNQI